MSDTFAKAGEKVRFLDRNGYDHELKAAQALFRVGEELTVSDVQIGKWSSIYVIEGQKGGFNTVMFEKVPVAPHGWVFYNSGPGDWFWAEKREEADHEQSDDIRPATSLEKMLLAKPKEPEAATDKAPAAVVKMMDDAADTFKRLIPADALALMDDADICMLLLEVGNTFRKGSLEMLIEDVNALNGARHLMSWLDGYAKPTGQSLHKHCKLLGKTPPDDCRDIDHVPPKNHRCQWILKAIIERHLNPIAK